MQRKEMGKRLSAGLFFVVGILLVMYVILVIGTQRGLTQPKFQVTLLFREVGGLTEGAPVKISGVTVGTVGELDFLEKEFQGRGVRVQLNIIKKYRPQIEKGHIFAIKTEGILGEKFVEISTNPYMPQPVDVTKPIIGVDPLDVQNLAETFGEAAVSLLETSKSIDEIIHELQNISVTSKRMLNRIEQRLIEGNLFKVF